MILPRVICTDYINKVCENIPPDVPTSKYVTHDLDAYYNAPKVVYNFNSRGFRDSEWPIDLSNKIWLVGDSGSMGIGIPYECTWPYMIEQTLNQRVIKVCKVNPSNDLNIFAWAKDILTNMQPKIVYVQWTYLWRNTTNKIFTLNPSKKDARLTISLMEKLETLRGNARVINVVTPFMHWDSYFLNLVDKTNVDKVIAEDIDLSRDMVHLGIESHKIIAKAMLDYLYEKNINYR